MQCCVYHAKVTIGWYSSEITGYKSSLAVELKEQEEDKCKDRLVCFY